MKSVKDQVKTQTREQVDDQVFRQTRNQVFYRERVYRERGPAYELFPVGNLVEYQVRWHVFDEVREWASGKEGPS